MFNTCIVYRQGVTQLNSNKLRPGDLSEALRLAKSLAVYLLISWQVILSYQDFDC